MKLCRAILPLLVVLLPGCDSGHQDVPERPDGEPVSFDIIPSSGSSVQDSTGIITTRNISEFLVCAYEATGGRPVLMNNVLVTRTGRNSWTYPDQIKWPEVPLNFEAVTPADVDISINAWDYPSSVKLLMCKNVNGIETPDATRDYCISVRRDAVKGDGKLRLNFGHCMAHVTLDIAADIPYTSVIVKEITMYRMSRGGDFHFPKATTAPGAGRGALDNCWTNWALEQKSMQIPYFQADDGMEVPLTSTPVSLQNKNNFFYVPIIFDPMDVHEGNITGSAIRVLCQFTNTADGTLIWPNNDTPYQLLPFSGSKYAYIFFPLQNKNTGHLRWQTGISYHYTITVRTQGSLPSSESAIKQKSSPQPPHSGTNRGNDISVVETDWN